MHRSGDAEVVRAWRPEVPDIVEVLHARFTAHAYPAHTHRHWTVLLVDQGGVFYDLEGTHHAADRAAVTILPPHVAHDGRAASAQGFRKRVVYLDGDWLPPVSVGSAVRHPALADPRLVGAVSALHGALVRRDDLEAETRLAAVRECVIDHLAPGASARSDGLREVGRGIRAGEVPRPERTRIAQRVREVLDADLVTPPSLASLAADLDVAPTTVVRAFRREFGLPPHRYLTGRRIDCARGLLLSGVPVADVAAEVGFHDQPHLTRHFRQVLGVTPGAYARPA